MIARFLFLIFLTAASLQVRADGCTNGNCPGYKRSDTSGSGNAAPQPNYAPPTQLTPEQCRQKDPIQWGLRFTYFRTVWAVVAVNCSTIPGTGVDKSQYERFTTTHKKDYEEVENMIGRASKRNRYSQEGRDARLKASQEQLNENARLLGTRALQAEELPWSESYETIGKYSEITTKMNDEEYEILTKTGKNDYCRAKSPDYREAMNYTPQQLHQRLADCVCENRRCETGIDAYVGTAGAGGGAIGGGSPAGGGGRNGGGASSPGGVNGGGSVPGTNRRGSLVVSGYGRTPPTTVEMNPAPGPGYGSGSSNRPAEGPDGKPPGGDHNKGNPAAIAPSTAKPPSNDFKSYEEYIYRKCVSRKGNKSLPSDANDAAFMLLQSEAFLAIYTKECGGVAGNGYQIFQVNNRELLEAARKQAQEVLDRRSLTLHGFMQHLNRIEAQAVGTTEEKRTQYCKDKFKRFTTLIATNSETSQNPSSTRSLEAAVCFESNR